MSMYKFDEGGYHTVFRSGHKIRGGRSNTTSQLDGQRT
jgi:hypothetical protein